MPADEIRKRFLSFFEKRGHAIVPSASLIPEGDASTLFTTAGMQPLSPYLLGAPHPKGTRIADIQKCVRTGDIDDVGDNRHLTFFEMLGNWSFGDYFKKEAIAWSYELLTSKDEGFGLDPKRLYITCFEGNDDAPRDDESAQAWQNAGISQERIFFLGKNDNWWSPGDNGPAGPDTEMFYNLHPEEGPVSGKDAFVQATESGRIVEIWNDVFMQYEQKDGAVIRELPQKNVDTGAGLERLATVLQGKESVFDTDLFAPIMKTLPSDMDERVRRIIADHIKAAVFMIADGVTPSNTDRGYVVRKLIRRAVTKAFLTDKEYDSEKFNSLAQVVMDTYPMYVDTSQQENIKKEISLEIRKFRATIEKGLIEEKRGADPFVLFTSYGIPFEVTRELARERGEERNEGAFREKMKKHQEISRAGSEQKFKGGLADTSPEVVKLHTATHLLNAALKKVLGNHVKQRGSNITPERLRFDFSHPAKLTDAEKHAVETQINDWIAQGIPVVRKEMPRAEAETLGAEMEFGAKYPDVVSVYVIETTDEIVSREFCGGPHVENTKDIGHVTLIKEESVAAGIRRIKAVLK